MSKVVKIETVPIAPDDGDWYQVEVLSTIITEDGQ